LAWKEDLALLCTGDTYSGNHAPVLGMADSAFEVNLGTGPLKIQPGEGADNLLLGALPGWLAFPGCGPVMSLLKGL
jgi:hypothetical protein